MTALWTASLSRAKGSNETSFECEQKLLSTCATLLCYDERNESHRNTGARPRRRIFSGIESLCDCGYAGTLAALRSYPSSAVAPRALASSDSRSSRGSLPGRILRRQDSLCRYSLGRDPHFHSSARCRAACLWCGGGCSRGVALGGGAACRRRRAHLARHESQCSRRREHHAGAV